MKTLHNYILYATTVFLSVLASSGCKKDCPQAEFSILGSGGIAPCTVQFKVETTPEPTFIKWDFGDGNILINESTPTHVFTLAGEYTVKLITSGANCKEETVREQKVIVYNSNNGGGGVTADFSFQGTNDLKAPSTVTFTNQSQNATSYKWNFGDGGSQASDQNPTHLYNTAGTYTVTLIATGVSSADTISKNITIQTAAANAPVAGFTLSNNNCTAACTVSFTNTSINADSYSWNFGDGSSPNTSPNPSHTYNNSGTYNVTLTASKTGFTPSSSTQQVTIQQAVVTPPDAEFNFSNNYCDAPCTVYFENLSTNADSYHWDFDDGTSSTQTNPSHLFDAPGTYYVTLTASKNNQSDTRTKEVTISSKKAYLSEVKLVSISTNCSYSGYPDYSFTLYVYSGGTWNAVYYGSNNPSLLPAYWNCFSNCFELDPDSYYGFDFYINDFGACYSGSSAQLYLDDYSGMPTSIDLSDGSTSVAIKIDWQ